MPILVIRSSTISLQSTGKRIFRDGTHGHTHRHTDDSWTPRLIEGEGDDTQSHPQTKSYRLHQLNKNASLFCCWIKFYYTHYFRIQGQ